MGKNMPAYPVTAEQKNAANAGSGITVRDYLAARAPDPPEQWWLDNSSVVDKAEVIARWRWHYADTMLAERERNDG